MQATCYIDLGSPYAYLGWQRIQKAPQRFPGLRFVCVSAAHIFRADGTVPNMTLPNQSKYLVEDLTRACKRIDVPFQPPMEDQPGAMPVNSLAAMRMWHAAQDDGQGDAWLEACYLAYFRDGRDISDRAVLDALAHEVGLAFDSSAADEPQWKQALVDATSRAYADGAPGVPFTVLENGDTQHFWGQDRLHLVAEALR